MNICHNDVIKFNLRMLSTMCSDNKENLPPKKQRISLSLKKNRSKEMPEEELISMSKPQIPKNTSISTRWAMKILTDWLNDYNKRNPSKCCPEEILSPSCESELLNKMAVYFCYRNSSS